MRTGLALLPFLPTGEGRGYFRDWHLGIGGDSFGLLELDGSGMTKDGYIWGAATGKFADVELYAFPMPPALTAPPQRGHHLFLTENPFPMMEEKEELTELGSVLEVWCAHIVLM
jgi:hypothetical protein